MATRKRKFNVAEVRKQLEASDSDTASSSSESSSEEDEAEDSNASDNSAAEDRSVDYSTSAGNWQRANKENAHIHGFLAKPGISVNTDEFEAILISTDCL